MKFLILLLMMMAQVAYATCACHSLPNRFASRMAYIPAGQFLMGGETNPDELPKHAVRIHTFWLDKMPVTNADFQVFVKMTGYLTTAEKKIDWDALSKTLPVGTPKPDESQLLPASLVFIPPKEAVALGNYAKWWSWKRGANWRHPLGAHSEIWGWDHPVVHVSWDDAQAYCKWLGKRLPTEAEWEWAARGGLKDKLYPWGDEPVNQGKIKANTWQGHFPNQNTLKDGYYYTSPVGHFAANGYGLYDMAGNVWEWVNDWYGDHYYEKLANQKVTIDPQGPETSEDTLEPLIPKKVLRGGSYLCNEAYCTGYRVAARMKASPDSSMQHAGFRCAR